jgi:uncharacterized membrane protein
MVMRTELHPSDREHRAVLDHLEAWESRELVTHDEAEAIRTFEQRHEEVDHGVPLVAEALGYLGAVLAVAAFFALIGPRWEDMDQWLRLTILGAGVVLTFAGGWLLRDEDEPALERLGSVLWTLSVAAIAGFLAQALVTDPVGDRPWALFVVALGSTGYAWALQRLRPCAPLQAALFVGTLGAFGGAAVWASETGMTWFDDQSWWFGVTTVMVSVAWILAGRAGLMRPRRAAYGIGAFGAVIGPTFSIPPEALGLWMGIAVSIGLIGASVVLRHTGVLALGAVGLFGYLTGTISFYLADTVGVPFALLLSGVVLVGVAIAVTKLRHETIGPATTPEVPARRKE